MQALYGIRTATVLGRATEEILCTVIPRLTSDPANEFLCKRRFFAVFWDSANELNSANECFSGYANMNGLAIPRQKFNQLWTHFLLLL